MLTEGNWNMPFHMGALGSVGTCQKQVDIPFLGRRTWVGLLRYVSYTEEEFELIAYVCYKLYKRNTLA